jgi:hypothetical protein
MMKNYRGIIFTGAGLLLVWLIFVGLKFYGGYWYDLYRSPWAYSRNPHEKLLVGKWEGDFIDPNGIKKQLILTIVEPTTNAERWEHAFTFKKHKRASSSKSHTFFDGEATVKSELGLEEYTVSGHVNEDDNHQFNLHFSPVDEKKRILPNFTLFDSNPNSWQNDDMKTTLTFAYHKADGSSFWSSSNPKHSAKIACKLSRFQH